MAIALVQSATAQSSTAVTNPSFAGATVSGNLIVLNFTSDDYNGTPDTGWTQSTGMEQMTFQGGYCWWRISTGQTSVTYTIGSATLSTWVLSEWSGADASPYDISNGQFQQTSTASYTTPALTPTAGNRLLVAGIGGSEGTGSAITAPASWTNSFTQVQSTVGVTGILRESMGVAYLLVAANGSTAYSTGASWTNTAQSKTGLIISFKEASAGGGAPLPNLVMAPPIPGGF